MNEAPVDAIDPDALRLRWLRSFEWHLDQVPKLLEAIGTLRTPGVCAYRYDRPRVTGGGYVDNLPIYAGGLDADQVLLWGMLVEYVRAVGAWLAVPSDEMPRAAGVVRDPDSRLALEAVGWLIARADDIWQVAELDDYFEEVCALVRRLRSRYMSEPRRREVKWLTYAEAAIRVDRSEKSIERWRRNGMPMSVDEEGRRVVDERVLLAWFKARVAADPVRRAEL